MKKTVLILMLAIVILTAGFAAGCTNDTSGEIANQDTTASEQNDIVSNEVIDDYMASVKEQSDAIKTSLEQDPLTQTELNQKSMEPSELWDGALNYLIDELENRLTDDEFSKLQDDQAVWAAEKDNAVAAAGAGFEGGSFYALIVNSEAARITEERALELYEMLK
ncbi:MAG: DUF1311 domain-containing protein [Clostridia bacterium]|nr:DUF1311 domain-containing protein [Clostridia bacterium]